MTEGLEVVFCLIFLLGAHLQSLSAKIRKSTFQFENLQLEILDYESREGSLN